jgi:hypothetical protein
MFDLIGAAISIIPSLAIGFGIGCWWYRRSLKNDPAKLERLAIEANAVGARVKGYFSDKP